MYALLMLQQEIQDLKDWTMALRGSLNRSPYYFNLESGKLRERLARLTSSADSFMRIRFDHGFIASVLSETDSDIDV